MSSSLAIRSDEVKVSVCGSLGYDTWRTLRSGRELALSRSLPLSIDISCCHQGEIAGIGSVLLAIGKLKAIQVDGCHGILQTCFASFGICKGCAYFATTKCSRETQAA